MTYKLRFFADFCLALTASQTLIRGSSTLNQTQINSAEGENLILPIRVRDEETQGTTQEPVFILV